MADKFKKRTHYIQGAEIFFKKQTYQKQCKPEGNEFTSLTF